MPTFKPYNQKQPMLLPPDIKDGMPTDHIGFVINDMVDIAKLCIDWKLEHLKDKMRTKLNTKQGKQTYLKRMSDVEPVFGNIKHNQKMTAFNCRGTTMVKIEFGLACIAHNFTKLNNWLKNQANKQQFEALLLKKSRT